MAFDAAASGQRPARSRASSQVAAGRGGADGDLQATSQRVWTLMQTVKSIEGLSQALGTADDTTALRAKLRQEETTAAALTSEIDSGIRKLRVHSMSGSGDGGGGQKPVDRLADQYGEVRRRIVEAVRVSQQKQRQFVPAQAPAAQPSAADSRRQLRVGGASTREVANPFGGAASLQPQPYAGGDDGSGGAMVLEMTAYHDVDDAIAQERAAEAAAIAREAVEIHGMMGEVSGMVHQQAEAVDAVEARVDETLERVQAGNQELVKAAAYQKSYRRKVCLFSMCVVALIGVVVVPIVIHYLPSINGGSGGGGGTSPSPTPAALWVPVPAGDGAEAAGVAAALSVVGPRR